MAIGQHMGGKSTSNPDYFQGRLYFPFMNIKYRKTIFYQSPPIQNLVHTLVLNLWNQKSLDIFYEILLGMYKMAVSKSFQKNI